MAVSRRGQWVSGDQAGAILVLNLPLIGLAHASFDVLTPGVNIDRQGRALSSSVSLKKKQKRKKKQKLSLLSPKRTSQPYCDRN